MTDSDHIDPQPPQLTGIELRVLGALMEKQLTTPDQYPLTVNGIITACNQKSNRDPVSNYSQGEIVRTLQELQSKRFVNKEHGSRAEKFSQHFIKQLELGKKHQAVLCVMMVRGPQTLSELNTRTQRMVDFTDKEDLEHTLDRLCNREIPYTIRLSQQPGQRGERFTHLFSGTPSQSRSVGTNPGTNPDNLEYANTPATTEGVGAVEQHSRDAKIEALEIQLGALSEESGLLKKQIARLYQLTGHEVDADVHEVDADIDE